MANVLRAFLDGQEARRQQDAADRMNAMNGYLQQNGQAIFNGDRNALGQLAGFGPEGLQTAMGVQGDMDARASRDEALGMQRERMGWEREDRQSQQSAQLDAQQQEELAGLMRELGVYYKNGDKAGFAAAVAKAGDDPNKFTFDAYPAMAAHLGLEAPETPEPLTDEGKRAYDAKNGWINPTAAPDANSDAETDLRKEYSGLAEVKAYKEQARAFASLQSAANRPIDATGQPEANAAADIALVFAFMKTLDPTSTVREAEFAAAAKAGSFGDQMANLVTQIESGEFLTPAQRKSMVQTAGQIFAESQRSYGGTMDAFRETAVDYGLDPVRAIPDARPAAPLISDRPVTRADGAAQPKRLKYNPATGAFE